MSDPLGIFLPLPFTKAIPFEFEFQGAQGENYVIWEPENAVFDFAGIVVRSVVPMDLNICDSSPAIPIAFHQTLAGVYTSLFLGPGHMRGVWSPSSKLILMDPVGVGVVNRIKGMVYGWEVNRDGFYR